MTLIFTQTKFICFKVKLGVVYSKELKSGFKQIFVHPVHSSTVHSSQKCKQPKHPLMQEWINKCGVYIQCNMNSYKGRKFRHMLQYR